MDGRSMVPGDGTLITVVVVIFGIGVAFGVAGTLLIRWLL